MIVMIGARGGSKRIKDKNIQEIKGLTLLYRAVLSAVQIGPSLIIVSSDMQTYLERVAGISRLVPVLRNLPTEDDESDGPWMKQAWRFAAPFDNVDIVLLRPTTVFRDRRILKHAWLTWVGIRGEGWTSLRSVERMTESLFKAYTRNEESRLLPIGMGDEHLRPDSTVRETMRPNGYIDILSARAFRENWDNLYGSRIYGYVTERAMEIDTPEDLERARLCDIVDRT